MLQIWVRFSNIGSHIYVRGQHLIVASEAISRLRGPPDLNKPGLGPTPGNGIWFLSPTEVYMSLSAATT